MITGLRASLIVLLGVLVTFPAASHGGEDHGSGSGAQGDVQKAATGEQVFSLEGQTSAQSRGGLGFKDNEGGQVPLDLTFTNAKGEKVTLAELTKGGERPLVFDLQYYECPNICGQILINIAEGFDQVSSTPGKDFQLVTLSISPEEGPKIASETKERTLKMFKGSFPDNAWSFLTGTKENIDALAESIGFKYRKRSDGLYDHPLGLVFVSPEGKITRYVHGLNYLPAALNMSILGASKGTVKPAVAKVLRLCFSYQPESNSLAFNVKKVTGVVTVIIAATFGVFLFFRSRRRRIQMEES